MTETDCLRVRRHDLVTEIVLDRPGAMNALSTALLRRLEQACREVAADPTVRAVVLAAAGERAFCVGADLKERAGMTDAQLLAQRPAFRSAFGALLAIGQPVIAAVHGYALGGGCELALSCDLIVADETAVFGLPETTVGLVPGCGGTQLTARRLGPGRAADLVLTGRRVAAAEAERIGLADRLVPAGTAGWTRWRWPGRSAATPRSRCGRPSGPSRRAWAPAWPPPWRSRTRPGGPPRCPPTGARASAPSPRNARRAGAGNESRHRRAEENVSNGPKRRAAG